MEPIVVRDSENFGGRDNKFRGDKTVRGMSMGNGPRKRLADISNLPQESKPANQPENMNSSSLATNQYVEGLRKENITLMKVLAERNKIIELSGIELQKLRLTVHKLQQQNIQLAQANNQMSSELNSSKEKQKSLNHELGCKNALLHAIKLELEEKTNLIMSQIIGKESKVESMECAEAVEPSQANNGDTKPDDTINRRPQSRKSSLVLDASKPGESKEKIDNDRHPLRRSKRFIFEEPERPEDLSEEPGLDLGPTTVKSLKARDNKRPCLRRQSARLEFNKPEPIEHLFNRDDDNTIELEKKTNNIRMGLRRQSARLEADEVGLLHERVDGKTTELIKKVENKSSSLRRQSMRFKSEEPEPIEALSEDPKSEEPEPIEAVSEDPKSEEPEPIEAVSEVPRPALSISSTVGVKPLKSKQNKSHSTKRQSVRVEMEECEPSQDLFKIDDAKFPVASLCDNLEPKSVPNSSVVKEDEERNNIGSDEVGEFTRLSMGRPSRRAAVKVQSYKEVPLNVKMRRSQ